MNDWKEAFWLAKFELKKLKLGFVLLALMAIMFSMFFATVFPKNMERSTVMLDFFSLLYLVLELHGSNRKNLIIKK